MKPRVSVLLPTYNRADLIGETIDSLLSQTRRADEILVIDDGSSDNTKAVVSEYGDAVGYLFKPNGGKASALNFGLQHSNGELIWICDDDDILLANACARLTEQLEADPELGFCAGRHEDFVVDPVSGKRLIKPPGYWRQSAPDEIFPDLLDGCHIFQPGLMVRRSSYDLVGEFDSALTRSQDYEMLLRLARRTRGLILKDVVFHHREHQGERGSASERFSMTQANAKWIRFHRIIMEPLVPDLDDEELLPATIWDAPERGDTRMRTAALKRASIYARNQLWPEAAEMWSMAVNAYSGPLDAYEQEIVKGATLYSLGCDGLVDDQAVAGAVLRLKKATPLGREIVSLIASSLRWRIKQAVLSGQMRKAAKYLRFWMAAR